MSALSIRISLSSHEAAHLEQTASNLQVPETLKWGPNDEESGLRVGQCDVAYGYLAVCSGNSDGEREILLFCWG